MGEDAAHFFPCLEVCRGELRGDVVEGGYEEGVAFMGGEGGGFYGEVADGGVEAG